MTKTTKTLLAISLIGFLTGCTDILWGFGKPIGAIFFGLFLISKMLEKEIALYDEEELSRRALADRNSPRPASPATQSRSHEDKMLSLAGHSAH